MGIENIIPNTKNPHRETPMRMRLLIAANRKQEKVNKTTVVGRENIKGIPPDGKVVVMTTHLTNSDIPVVLDAIADDLDLAVSDQSTHHRFFGSQSEPGMAAAIALAEPGSFLAFDYHKNASGEKSPLMFNPENFERMLAVLEKGKSLVVSAHNPSEEQRENLDSVAGGNGGVYLALLSGAYILPITVSLTKAETGKKEPGTIQENPNALVSIGKPFRLEKIEGLGHLAEIVEKRKGTKKQPPQRLTKEDVEEVSRLSKALHERSKEVMKIMSEQLSTQGQ